MHDFQDRMNGSSDGAILVKSRLRVWWLMTMKGYTLYLVRRLPKVSRLGSINYDVEWYLSPPEESAD